MGKRELIAYEYRCDSCGCKIEKTGESAERLPETWALMTSPTPSLGGAKELMLCETCVSWMLLMAFDDKRRLKIADFMTPGDIENYKLGASIINMRERYAGRKV